jgi:cytoskeletal protein CcmA (bactofilin family)
MATIGQSIVFKGELTGDEDLEIDGRVEGTVQLKNHQLTIGPNGNLKAEVAAKSIIVIGRVTGDLVAAERIEIQATGVVDGDVRAPKLNVQEGAVLNGGIDMSSGTTSDTTKTTASSSTSASPASPNPASAPI